MKQHTTSLWDSEDLENMKLPPCNKQMDVPYQVMDYIHHFGHVGKGTPIIEKIMDNPLDKDIKESLLYSLCSRRMYEKPSNILVKGYSGKLYPLKVRPRYDAIPLSMYVEYNEQHDYLHDYNEIIGKFIIIDRKQFNLRGREILSNL